MKLKDRYKALQNPKKVKERIIKSVHATMMLEGQGVSFNKLSKIYDELKATPKTEPAV